MSTALAISKYVNSLLEVEARFSARQNNSDRFFSEWYEEEEEVIYRGRIDTLVIRIDRRRVLGQIL